MSEKTKDNVLQWDLRDKIEEEDYNIDFVQSVVIDSKRLVVLEPRVWK